MNHKVVYNMPNAFYNLGFTVFALHFRAWDAVRRIRIKAFGELLDASVSAGIYFAVDEKPKHCWLRASRSRRKDGSACNCLDAPPEINGFHLCRTPARTVMNISFSSTLRLPVGDATGSGWPGRSTNSADRR